MNTDQIITTVAQHPGFSGVVYVRQSGEVFVQGYGFANRADRVPNTINTRFGIASGTKTFTAVAGNTDVLAWRVHGDLLEMLTGE